MIELKGQDGTPVFVKPSSVSRFRSSNLDGDVVGSKVDYAGASLQTPEGPRDLAARLTLETVPLVTLRARNGEPVWLNAAQITEIRLANPADGEGTQLRVGGKYQHVLETPEDVRHAVETATGGQHSD